MTTRDLFLTHLLDADAAKQIQLKDNADKSMKEVLTPLLENSEAAVTAFFSLYAELTGTVAAPNTVKVFIEKCDHRLQEGLELAAAAF